MNEKISKNLQLEIGLSGAAVVILLFGAFFLNSSTLPPKNYQEVLDQATGHRNPIMNTGYNNFYSFLRVYISSISVYFLFINYKNKNIKILLGLLVVVIIFNPMQPLSFDVGSLKLVDFFASLFFAYYLFLIYKSHNKIKSMNFFGLFKSK